MRESEYLDSVLMSVAVLRVSKVQVFIVSSAYTWVAFLYYRDRAYSDGSDQRRPNSTVTFGWERVSFNYAYLLTYLRTTILCSHKGRKKQASWRLRGYDDEKLEIATCAIPST